MELLVDPAVLVGFCLVLVRATAWALLCPPFNSPAIPVRVRVGLAVALSFVLAERVAISSTSVGTAELVGSLLLQAVAGAALGFFVLALFSAVQTAGELIDLQVGFSLGLVVDPLTGNGSTPIGRLHQLFGIAILFAINGHVIVLRAFLRSVEIAPLADLDLAALATQLVGLLGVLLVAAVEIALPVLTALFLAEVGLGLLGKAAPQLNILVLGFAAKALLAFALLGVSLVLLPTAVDSLVARAIRAGLGVFGGGG